MGSDSRPDSAGIKQHIASNYTGRGSRSWSLCFQSIDRKLTGPDKRLLMILIFTACPGFAVERIVAEIRHVAARPRMEIPPFVSVPSQNTARWIFASLRLRSAARSSIEADKTRPPLAGSGQRPSNVVTRSGSNESVRWLYARVCTSSPSRPLDGNSCAGPLNGHPKCALLADR